MNELLHASSPVGAPSTSRAALDRRTAVDSLHGGTEMPVRVTDISV
jgi:hypothetical protein